ncbi:MAG: methyltransferase family protein [Candidatus Woesearchaeota archaeon]
MKLFGRPPINPLLFFTGKLSGYICWIFLLLFFFGIKLPSLFILYPLMYFVFILSILGLIIVIVSLFNLRDSISLGVPVEKTSLKTKGIYALSRNPMYLGFNLLTLSAILTTLNIVIIFLGVYTILVYHLIILGEEKFLRDRFGASFINYCKKVRRYF